MSVAAGVTRQTMLTVNISDENMLYNAYMPFIKGGGLFAQTPNRLPLGQAVFMVVTLPGSSEKLPVSGKVCWVTPVGAQGNRPAGVGVQFDDTRESAVLKDKIETMMAGKMGAEKATFTM
ncbi:pilus assembly protein PilZ [Lysobacteraceae bacterium NML75-0749]|nr:pilus assembly protein PilZ [Xanthomonadaceae bacterium NML75-0749]PJK00257.1 pilus assembly protein PilZ [Xanthomonadaceae bacterium NML03-0222]PJK05820.1 pilus assembly protein PilZ [Xanthomonadaceae bacterium NML91-0268]PJK06537.1 pilus assembly protein PilZ [Xanthomonadaceae bacterium NML71-0210]